jgi:integrase
MRDKLTAAFCEKTNKPGMFSDGGGLYLEVKKRRIQDPDDKEKKIVVIRKYWHYRWRDRFEKYTEGDSAGISKLRQKGLGPFGLNDVTLKEARQLAGKCRRMVRDNKSPIKEAHKEAQQVAIAQASTLTFKECSTRYIDAHKDGWRNAKHTAQWSSTLNTYAARLMPLDVAEINTQMVIKCIQPIWKTKTETATRVRQRIESVLDWATAREFRTGDNPARWKGHIENLLPKPRKVRKVVHHPALDYQQTGAFMQKLRAVDTVAAKVLEFQILTATRPGEATGALWDEIDLKRKIWTIPADRMKADKEHEIPLSPQAIKLLNGLVRTNDFVFPGWTGKKPITSAAGMKLLKELHPGITQHGFRSTFRVWGSEQTSYPLEVLEHALAHQLKNKTQAAYDRKTMFPKRMKLMKAWSDYCDQVQADVDNVTPIRGAKS